MSIQSKHALFALYLGFINFLICIGLIFWERQKGFFDVIPRWTAIFFWGIPLLSIIFGAASTTISIRSKNKRDLWKAAVGTTLLIITVLTYLFTGVIDVVTTKWLMNPF